MRFGGNCWHCRFLCIYCIATDFRAFCSGGYRSTKLSAQHKSGCEIEYSISHITRHYAKPLLPAALLFCRVCSLSFRVCLGAWAWWLFCNFWSVSWLVRIANVLTLVRWLYQGCSLPSKFKNLPLSAIETFETILVKMFVTACSVVNWAFCPPMSV